MHIDQIYRAECISCGTRKATWIPAIQIYLCKECFCKEESFAKIIEKAEKKQPPVTNS